MDTESLPARRIVRTKALGLVKFLLLAAVPFVCSSCSGLLVEACVKDAPKDTLLDGSPRSNMTRWLGKPRETMVFPPSTVPVYSDAQPPPVKSNEVRRMDYYRVSGRVDIPGVNAPEVGNLYGLVVIMTLGVSEVFAFPYTVVNLTVRSCMRHQFRVWYDASDRLVDTKTGSIERHPLGTPSARELREVQARPLSQPGDLRLEVKSAGLARSCVVCYTRYTNYAPPLYLPVMDRGKKEVRFIIGKASEHVLKSETKYALLIVRYHVVNVGIGTANFRPMALLLAPTNAISVPDRNMAFLEDYVVENQLRLVGSRNALAIGAGDIPFMKDHLFWKEMRKHEPEKIPAGGRKLYSYVFAVNRNQSRWVLHYDGKPVSELELNVKSP